MGVLGLTAAAVLVIGLVVSTLMWLLIVKWLILDLRR
jgi:hypothetical protein